MEKLAIGTALMLSLSVQVNAQPLGQQLTDQHWAARGPLMQCIYPFGLSQIGLEQSPIRLTISRICQVCGAFSFGDLIETRGDGLAEASDGECAVLERI